MVEWLESYLKSTSKENLDKQWGEIEKLELDGPNAFEYLEYLQHRTTFYVSSDSELEPLKIDLIETPAFPGFIFCLNSHHERCKTRRFPLRKIQTS